MDDRYSILIVDDEDEVRTAIRRSLHVPGYTIYEACDGVEGLEVLRKHQIDAIVADYNMPRMNGLDFLQQVRITRPNVLRILLTARADVHLAVRALNEGALHRFLLKPWDHFDLRGILRIALHKMRSPSEAPTDVRQGE
jgi:CheY-like chemotaxis protein